MQSKNLSIEERKQDESDPEKIQIQPTLNMKIDNAETIEHGRQ